MTKAGRPQTLNRNAAIVLGEKTYEGKRCKKCAATERYTKGGACVHCQRNYSVESRAALKRLLQEDDRKFGEHRQKIEQLADDMWNVNDDSDGKLDAGTEPGYLKQDEIPQPWD